MDTALHNTYRVHVRVDRAYPIRSNRDPVKKQPDQHNNVLKAGVEGMASPPPASPSFSIDKILVWNATKAGCDTYMQGDHPTLKASCCASQLLLPDAEMLAGYVVPWLLVLCWVFSGVALGAEVFMTSIEVITSKEKVKKVTVDGKTKHFHTRVRTLSFPPRVRCCNTHMN